MKARLLREERGYALVVVLLVLLVLTVIGIAGISTSTYGIFISGNSRASKEAFYIAEAGINEFIGRFRQGASDIITDSSPDTATWNRFLAASLEKAGTIGCPSNADFIQSLHAQMDFRVKVTHKLDLANNVVKKNGAPVYIVRSSGFTPDGGERVIEVEINKSPSLDPPGALYSERPLHIQGSSTYIQGNDGCGTNNKPGIATTLPNSPPAPDPIDISGGPTIQGTPPKQYDTPNLDLRGMADYLKKYADFTYDHTHNEVLTGASDQWGTPTSTDTSTPITYDGPMNIVYFDMHGTNLKLSGGSHGAGILVVDGNLELNGGFTWYGLVIVMGALDYTGGGQKNITGGVLTGESATVQIDVGGNAGILYCSAVGNKLKDKVGPLRITKWREVF